MKKGFLTYREISALLLEISMFLHSGSSASAALAYLADTEPQKERAELYRSISLSLDSGRPLYLAFDDAKIFPHELVLMLEVADKTGRYESALSSASRYYERLYERDRQLCSAVVYPCVLLLVMAAVVVLLLIYVMPVFADVYASFGITLGGFSSFLLLVGDMLRNVWWLVLAIFVLLCIFIVSFSACESLRTRMLGSSSQKRRGVAKKLGQARFASALSMALASGLSLEAAVECAGRVLGEKNKDRIEKCITLLSSAEPIYKSFSAAELLPLTEARLLVLGINGGGTDAAAEQIASRLDGDADDAITKAIEGIEPIMVICAALLIGAILISVMIPLANIMAFVG